MRPTLARLATGVALVSSVTAILVTPDSPCEAQCGNVLSATTGPDIECEQNNYGSAAGTVFKNCINCELRSTYYSAELGQSDQEWMLYNSRYALSYCVFGDPGNHAVGNSPCLTSRACGVLKGALEYGNFSTKGGAYDYCTKWDYSELVTGCENCLRVSGEGYLANMVALLQVGCKQRPPPGSTVSVEGAIFSTDLLNGTTPTPAGSWTGSANSGPLSLGAEVAIAIGGLCVLLAVAGFCIVCNGRRRRRAYLRKLEMRQKDQAWPHAPMTRGIVINRGADMNETPLSQKPLRGWDDSPQSATAPSDPSYGRYFSPYSSQYNSPVSAAGTPGLTAQQWPQDFHSQPQQHQQQQQQQQHHDAAASSLPAHGYPSWSQEKAMQDQHDAAALGPSTHQPIHIGVALGGDEPSLRTEPSTQSFRGGGAAVGEEYELHEVGGAVGPAMAHSDSSFRTRVARASVVAPVLQHPGYGRHSPDKTTPTPPPAATTATGSGDA